MSLKLTLWLAIAFVAGVKAIVFENQTGKNIYIRIKDGDKKIILHPTKLVPFESKNLGKMYLHEKFPFYIRLWLEQNFNHNNPDDETKPTGAIRIDMREDLIKDETYYFEQGQARLPNTEIITYPSLNKFDIKYRKNPELYEYMTPGKKEGTAYVTGGLGGVQPEKGEYMSLKEMEERMKAQGKSTGYSSDVLGRDK